MVEALPAPTPEATGGGAEGTREAYTGHPCNPHGWGQIGLFWLNIREDLREKTGGI